MGSISNIVYYVINYHCAKFGASTINSTIISPFCWIIPIAKSEGVIGINEGKEESR